MQTWGLPCIRVCVPQFPLLQNESIASDPRSEVASSLRARGQLQACPEGSPTAQESHRAAGRVLGEKAVAQSQVICSEPQGQSIQFHVCQAVPARGRAERQQSPLALSCVLLLVPLPFPSQNQIKSLLLVPFLYTTPCTISE